MNDETSKIEPVKERPDAFWRKVYFAVIVSTVVVIAALWSFSEHFSS